LDDGRKRSNLNHESAITVILNVYGRVFGFKVWISPLQLIIFEKKKVKFPME